MSDQEEDRLDVRGAQPIVRLVDQLNECAELRRRSLLNSFALKITNQCHLK